MNGNICNLHSGVDAYIKTHTAHHTQYEARIEDRLNKNDEITRKIQNRLPNWAVGVIAFLTSIIGWMSAILF